MYQNLLKENEQISILDAPQRLELQDYINMRKSNLPTLVKWDYIKSMCITDYGSTLWQLSEKHLNSQESRAIGQIESPVSLFEWMLKKSKK